MDADTLEDLYFQVQASGFCVLKNVIPADRCCEIRDRVFDTVQRESARSATGQSAAARGVGFTPSVINHEQSFAEFLADDRLLALVGRLLGEHVRISFTSAIINQPRNERGDWHADWPFNQRNAGHVPAPYPDTVMHLTMLWMLSHFEAENGGTLVLPGSHRCSTNPTAREFALAEQAAGAQSLADESPANASIGRAGSLPPRPDAQFETEIHATGPAGSVLLFDSRLWHATAPNHTDEPRVALAVRYAPWWLNLEVLRPHSDERRRMCDESDATDNEVPSIRRDVFDRLPPNVQPLYRHWLEPTHIPTGTT